ncbi:hypothetical protein [Maribellus sediminis]|uniref:hypothetical protein n=1 Tax=Maribellus sediminis TaxID=2696285 RepID=UPI00142FFE74|nr:hypothetical protein [Maribellus sediminis]
MKTKNNVQKTITKAFAVIISLVLISITVQAQEFWKSVLKNNSFHQIAMAMVDEASVEMDVAPVTTEATFYYEEEADEALNVEDWMVNENYFGTGLNYETETENSLELEDWMVNENLFTGLTGFNVETEAALELEDWMTNTNYFGVRTVEVEMEHEAALQLDTWMTSSKTWRI